MAVIVQLRRHHPDISSIAPVEKRPHLYMRSTLDILAPNGLEWQGNNDVSQAQITRWRNTVHSLVVLADRGRNAQMIISCRIHSASRFPPPEQ